MFWLLIIAISLASLAEEAKKPVNWNAVCLKIDSLSEKDREKYQKILDKESENTYEIQLEELCERTIK